MTVFYVDPVGGNNANNGQSFANRVKSLSAVTSSSTDFTDEIRFIEDTADVSLGNFTFTNGNFGIVPDTPLDVVNIFSGTVAYTGVVSPTTQASNTRGAAQAAGQAISATAASAVGKLAYYTLPSTLNLSAYDVLSFLAFGTHLIPALDIKLCSDATGDVPIASFHVAVGAGYDSAVDGALADTASVQLATNMLLPIGFRGVSLPNGVNSIAIYRRAVVAAGTFAIANVTASKLATGINHLSLFGKKTVDEPAWYSVRTILPNLVEIGPNSTYSSQRLLNINWRGYFGVEGSHPVFAKNPYLASFITASRQLPNNGGHRILGGYNRTDMSSKTGVTTLHSGVGVATPIINPAKYVQDMDNFNFVNLNGPAYPIQQGAITNIGILSRLTSGVLGTTLTTVTYKKKVHLSQVTHSDQISLTPGTNGFQWEAIVDLIKDPAVNSATTAAVSFGQSLQNIDPVAGARWCKLRKLSNSAGDGIQLTNAIQLSGPTVWENPKAGIRHIIGNADGSGMPVCIGYPDTTDISMASVSFTGVISSEYTVAAGRWRMDMLTTKNHGAMTRSPKFTIFNGNNNPVPHSAVTVSVAQIYVEAGKTLTFKMWENGDVNTTGTQSVLMIKAFSVPGVDDDIIVANTPTVGTWAERTITVTPTIDCIVSIEAGVCGNVNSACTWSDPSWTIT